LVWGCTFLANINGHYQYFDQFDQNVSSKKKVLGGSIPLTPHHIYAPARQHGKLHENNYFFQITSPSRRLEIVQSYKHFFLIK